MSNYPSYDPALGHAQLANGKESYICNTNTKLNAITRTALIGMARRRYAAADRSTLQFAADLRRLHDARVHKASDGSGDFGLWATGIFDGLSRANARLLCWQGAVLLILEGHGLVNLDDTKPRVGATAVRKLARILGYFGEDVLLEVWHQAVEDKPGGKFSEIDIADAMKNTGTFMMNGKEEAEEPDEITVPLGSHPNQEDLHDGPDYEGDVNLSYVEAIVHLHQELVDPFDKLRRELVKLTDPDNQPYDIEKIRQQFDKAVSLLIDLENLLEDHDDTEAAEAA